MAFVQAGSDFSPAGMGSGAFTTKSYTLTAGNWVPIWVFIKGDVISSVTSSKSDTITLLVTKAVGGDNLYLYGLPNAIGGATTFSITGGASTNFVTDNLLEMSGRIPTLSAVDQLGPGAYNSTSFTTSHVGDATPSSVVSADDVVWGATDTGYNGTEVYTVVGAWTLPAAGQISGSGAGNPPPGLVGYQVNVIPATYQVQYTSSASILDASIILGLKATSLFTPFSQTQFFETRTVIQQ